MALQVGKVDVATRGVKVSQTYCQQTRQKVVRCNVLEPVLEHCETPSEKSGHQGGRGGAQGGRRGKPMRMLLRLRDGYVKLMNDISSGADLAGVSSFYGCDYPVSAMANSRIAKEEQEREIMLQGLHMQMAHSHHCHGLL